MAITDSDRTKLLQVFKPQMGREEIDAVADVLESGWIGLGPKTAEFERRFADYVGADHAVGVNSCTAALDLSLKLLGIRKGDEVLVPTMTFVSTAHVVAYNDATPIFVEPESDTLCMDLEDAARKLSPRTKAVIYVHFGGRMGDPARLRDFAKTHDIHLIEDCAHAAGARHGELRAGAVGDIGCFSFHAVKNLAMGDGGALTLNDEGLADRARRLRWLGIDKGTWSRTSTDRSYWWEYAVEEIGLKCHMNDIAAAIGLVQLRKLDAMNARRRQIAGIYSRGLEGLSQVVTPPEDTGASRSAWHIYHLQADDRDALSVHLKDSAISTGVHYKPIHTYRCYGASISLPTAEAVFPRLLSLPMYPDLTDHDAERVVSCIYDFYDKARQASTRGRSTPSVSLRHVCEDDLDNLRMWRNDPDVRPWFFDDRKIEQEDQQKWWRRYSEMDDDELFVIQDADGQACGTIGLSSIDSRNGTAELGRCMIERACWGRGLMRAAIGRLFERAFGPMSLRRLYLEVHSENTRAIAAYEACGFRTEGIARGARVVRGEPIDVVTMALLRPEYEKTSRPQELAGRGLEA